MNRSWLPVAILALGALAVGVVRVPGADDPPPANTENIGAALKLTQAAAAEYEFRTTDDEKEGPLELRREPVLKWSNPDRGEVHGNVFLWTRDGRPLVVGSLFKWFSPHAHMSNEFHSLAEGPLFARFHGQPVWKPGAAGLTFADVPKADAPAADEAKRLLQLKQLAKDFAGDKKEREDANRTELRLLPQPLYRYAVPKQGIVTGALFALVHGTDPEIWLLIEARGASADQARWQFAAARMSSVDMKLHYKGAKVWSAELLPWKAINDHQLPYTSFMFKEIPDFLKNPPAKPKP